MIIKLQYNKSEENRLKKSLSLVAELDGTLRDSTSIIDPVIRIQCDLETIIKTNYLTIPDFKRRYFIKNIVSIRNNLWEIQCHVDVLTSFKDEIRKCKGVVCRQASKFNLYLDDGSFKTYQNPHIVTKAFPNGFSGSDFVLVVAGGNQVQTTQ